MKHFIPVFVAALTSLLASCAKVQERPEALARRYCSSCHAFVEPALLDKSTWESRVLPEMSFRMGLDLSKMPGTNAVELHEILKSIPENPMVSKDEWASIKKYFVQHAPAALHTKEVHALPIQQFGVSTLQLPVSNRYLLTMLRYNPLDGSFFIGTRKGDVFKLTTGFAPEDSITLKGPASDITFHGKEHFISSMGIMDPNDLAAGSVSAWQTSTKDVSTLIDSLKRPVHLEQADLNTDGEDDLIVSAFGNFTGGLFAFEKKAGKFTKHTIHNFSGTRKTIVRDFNGDGLPDIMALITQGDERIALFTNRGNFRFSYQVLLRFPPVYGSSYFELADFDSDGYLDILYTNGDNADYSPVLKPYHGVRIFLNDGQNHFTPWWLHPMHGASMAKAADFDEDGDIDIAAISFFPDFTNHPDHSFLYFENQGKKFAAFFSPLAASSRWITMESADIDDDGDRDILLGALAFPSLVPDSLLQQWMKNKTSLLVLKNNLR